MTCYNVVFRPSEFCQIFPPKSMKWHFPDSRFKNFPGEHAPGPPQQNSRQRRSTRAFGPRFQPPQSQTASYGPECYVLITVITIINYTLLLLLLLTITIINYIKSYIKLYTLLHFYLMNYGTVKCSPHSKNMYMDLLK